MLHIDLKYIAIVGPALRNFKKKKLSLYNCSCPLCGDSEKKRTKARGFFYQKGQSMYYKCHNCSAGMGVGNFLKQLFPTHYSQFLLDKYKNGTVTASAEEQIRAVAKVKFSTLTSSHATKISDLEEQHFARQYVTNRKIPTKHFNKIFFTQDFSSLVEDVFPGKYQNLSKNDSRLVIPFFDQDDRVIGLQGRSFFSDSGLRYITIRFDSDVNLVYGLDRVKYNETIYVVEGPIDSLFLPNCIAAANSDLVSAISKVGSDLDCVLVFDNEPKNKEIVGLIEDAISKNKKVCVWPSSIREKDINDMILSGRAVDDVIGTIKERTFCGLSAELELAQWRRS